MYINKAMFASILECMRLGCNIGVKTYLYVLCVFFMQGCAKGNIDVLGQSDDIVFNSITNGVVQNTKSGSITTGTLQNFGIFTYITDAKSANSSDFVEKMFNAKYQRDLLDDVFKPVDDGVNDFFWSYDYHHFFAYAPYNTTGVEFVDAVDVTKPATDAAVAVKYTLTSNNPDEHTDLLFAKRGNVVQIESNIV